ncbi:helix-turn-helix domain-containing protein [Flectobacillus roseus]
MYESNLAFFTENANKPAVFLTVEEFSTMVSSIVECKLNQLLQPSHHAQSSHREEHFNFTQAVEFLKISKPTFIKLRREGKIKGMKVGEKRLLFSRLELEAFLKNNHE